MYTHAPIQIKSNKQNDRNQYNRSPRKYWQTDFSEAISQLLQLAYKQRVFLPQFKCKHLTHTHTHTQTRAARPTCKQRTFCSCFMVTNSLSEGQTGLWNTTFALALFNICECVCKLRTIYIRGFVWCIYAHHWLCNVCSMHWKENIQSRKERACFFTITEDFLLFQ